MDLPTKYHRFSDYNSKYAGGFKGDRYFENRQLQKLLIEICPLYKPLPSEPNVPNMRKLAKTGARNRKIWQRVK